MLPLKRDSEGILLPVKEQCAKVPPLDDLVLFFRWGFAPGERKFKTMLLVQMGARLRINEVCAINLRDFLPNTRCRKFKVLIQKKNHNYIVTKELPESIASFVRAWISDNYEWILSKEGFVFPHVNSRSLYTTPHAIQDWFCRKRKQLMELFPDRSFGDTVGRRNYGAQAGCVPKGKQEFTHLWRSHTFKHIPLTLVAMIEKDAEFLKALACHEKYQTTSQFYIDQVRMLENREGRVMNKVFDQDFYDAILGENENIPAVFEDVRRYNQTK